MTSRTDLLRTAVVAVFALAAAGVAQAAKPSDPPRSTPVAAGLVRQALEAELAGNATERSRLLAEAQSRYPQEAAAHWAAGEVYFDGQWRSSDQVAAHIASDPRRKEYRDLRMMSADGALNHQALARWCAQQELTNEERYHWLRVLAQAPAHEEARESLDLHPFEGGLLTRGQIDDLESQRKKAKDDLRRFRPRLVDLRRRAASRDPGRRRAALAELEKLSDPAALGALEELLVVDGTLKRELIRKLGRPGVDRFLHDLRLAAIAALGNMPQHAATLDLVQAAIHSPWDDARLRAAELLKTRPKTDYMPQLMAALHSPIESSVSVFAAPDGTVRVLQSYFQEGPLRSASHTEFTSYEVRNALLQRALVDKQRIGATAQRHLARAANKIQAGEQAVAANNELTRELNGRIIQTLKTTTGADAGDDPAAWWKAWSDENELYYTEDEPYETYEYHDYCYRYPIRPTYVPTPVREATTPVRTMSCFVEGTPVVTDAGLVPIEEIVAGDMVLSQDPLSGELAYQPVVETTRRPPTPTVKLSVGDETIVATRGHRFWVNGAGWTMAKALTSAASLHAIEGAAPLTATAAGEEVEAYNLVVDDFHTYFVGKARLLVHDNSCPRPTLAAVPGLASLAAGRPPN